MEEYRLIHLVSKSKQEDKEQVLFTDDFDSPATDWCTFDIKVVEDTIIDADLPTGFPINWILSRSDI